MIAARMSTSSCMNLSVDVKTKSAVVVAPLILLKCAIAATKKTSESEQRGEDPRSLHVIA